MLFPAAKLLDGIIGVDAHAILAPAPPAPAPVPVPMVPHPFIGNVFLWHSPKFPSADVFINGLPAITVGAKSYSVHFPMPPGIWWPNPAPCFMKWFLMHYTTVALSTVFSTLTAATGAMLGIGVPYTAQRGKEVEANKDGSNFWEELNKARPQLEWHTILRTLMPPAVLPIAEGDVSLGSPTVTVNGAPIAFVGPLTAGSCTDLPMIPNAITLGFTNVFVGVTLKELLMQLAWNAVNAATSILAGKLANRFATRVTGEPIDICTGSVIEDPIDLEIPGPIPFRWVRHYSSVLVQDGPLGWCWTHEYHRYLKFDTDTILYHDEEGRETRFPQLTQDQPTIENKQASMTLHRIDKDHYELQRRDDPLMLFTFDGLAPRAMMTELRTLTGAAMRFVYDKELRLVSIVDSGTRTFSLRYHDATSLRIASLRCTCDSYQNDVDIFLLGFTYDDLGDLVAVTDAAGNSERYTYGDEHHMASRTNKLGYSFHYEYNNAGQCNKSYGDDDLYHVELEHLPSVNMVKVTEPLGGVYLYRFDEQSRVIQLVDAYGHGRLFGYDKDGNCNLFTNQSADVMLYEYDKSRHKTLEIDPLGREKSWKYDDKGREVEKTDATGNITKRTYDEHDNLIEEIAADGAVTKHEYDEHGRKITTTFPDDSVIRFQYGPHSLPEALLDKYYQRIETYEYDVLGNRTAIIADGERTSFQYDTLNRLYRVDYPDGTSAHQTFDVEGNILSYVNRNGAQWRYTYGSWNKLMQEEDPEGNRTEFTYNKWDKINSITDPNGNHYAFDHDLCNRCTGIKENGFVMETFELDPAGKVIGCSGPDGKRVITFQRGKGGLVEKEVHASGKEIVYTYTETGAIAGAESDDFRLDREYDAIGRLSTERCNDHEVRFTHDKYGVQESTLFSGKYEVTRKFDPETGVVTVTDPLGNRHNLIYQNRTLVERSVSWGLTEQSKIDSENRVVSQTLDFSDSDSGSHRERSYTYDAESNLLSLQDSETGFCFFQYDRASRLSKASSTNDNEKLCYRYDAAGNLIELPDGILTTVERGNRITSAGNTRYDYDIYGRLARKTENNNTTQFNYDSAGLLTSVIHPDGTESRYTYDAFRRRIAKAHGGVITRYLWESDRLVGECIENRWYRCYIYGRKDDLAPCAFTDFHKIGEEWKGTSYAVHTDHMGTPYAVSDETGAIVWSVELLPYGSVKKYIKKEIYFNLRFPGQYFDEETGLHYNRHRYYDPELGRYISPDPIGFSGGINLYAYPQNPLKKVDFLGLHEGQNQSGNREGEDSSNEGERQGTNAEHAESRQAGENATTMVPIKRTESSADSTYPLGTKKVEYGDPVVATYWVDSNGRTLKAEGVLDPPSNYTKSGVSHILPDGFQTGIDHRGHLIPERSTIDKDSVNVPENVIAEHGRKSNLSAKKRWENRVKKHSEKNPGCKSVHEPVYDGADPRPLGVNHKLIDANGNTVPGFTQFIENPQS